MAHTALSASWEKIYARYAAIVEQAGVEKDLFKQQRDELFAANYLTFRDRTPTDQLIEVLQKLEVLNRENGEKNIADVCQSEIRSLRSILAREDHAEDLYKLAEDGDVISIRTLMTYQRVGVNQEMQEGQSMLHIAAELGHFRLARLLLLHGAQVTFTDQNGKKPWELAKAHQHEYLKNLLGNPFYFAQGIADEKSSTELKKFFRQEKELNKKVDKICGMRADVHVESFVNGRVAFRGPPLPLIHHAVRALRPRVVELLLAHGASPHAVDDRGNNALQAALLKRSQMASVEVKPIRKITRIAFLLLSKGSALEVKNHVNQSTLGLIKKFQLQETEIGIMVAKAKQVDDAVRGKRVGELTTLLKENPVVGAGFGSKATSSLAGAVELVDIGLINLLIDYQPTLLDLSDHDGNQPLHLAALSGNLQLVQLLLERGARVEDKNGQRKTAFQLARSNPLLSLAAALMQDALYLYDTNKKGFFKDETTREIELGKILDKIRVNLQSEHACRVIRVRNALNKTLLHLLCEMEIVPLEFIQLAVNLGARLNVRNFRGANPLHNIAKNRLKDSRQLLDFLNGKFGAELQACMSMADEQEKKTPPMIAAMNGNLEFVQWAAENRMVDFNARDEHGNTILLLACESYKDHATETAVYLLERCNPLAQDQHGHSCLLNAAKVGNIDIIERLIKKGADIRDTNNKKRNLFHVLCREGKFEHIFSFFDQKNWPVLMQWPLKELFEALDLGDERCPPSRFYELLAHNKNLRRKQSQELDERGTQLVALLKELSNLVVSEKL